MEDDTKNSTADKVEPITSQEPHLGVPKTTDSLDSTAEENKSVISEDTGPIDSESGVKPMESSDVKTEQAGMLSEPSEKASPQHKKRVAKFIRNIFITILVFIVVIVLAGIGYVWYSGKQEVVAVPVVEPTTQKVALPKPTKPSPNNPVGVSVQAVSSPVARGENSSINVKTTPSAICSISVLYNAVASTDSGLVKKTADDYGTVGWSWTVGASTPIGEWPVRVTCVYGAKSGMVQTDIQVTK